MTFSSCIISRVFSPTLAACEGNKSACCVLLLGGLGVTLTVTPPECNLAVGKRENFSADWDYVRSVGLMTSGSSFKVRVSYVQSKQELETEE